MNKRIFFILSASTILICLVTVAVVVYDNQIIEVAEKSEVIAIRTTPVSPFPLNDSIKGLTIANITSFLENNDFICPQKSAVYISGYDRTSCEQKEPEYDLTIHIFSSGTQNIYLIETQVDQLTHPTNDQAVNFLGFITRLPIEGVDGSLVKSWITTALPTIDNYPGLVVEKRFNGLTMRLYGSAQLRSLEIIGNQ